MTSQKRRSSSSSASSTSSSRPVPSPDAGLEQHVLFEYVPVTDPDGAASRLAPEPVRPGRSVGTMPAAAPGVWSVSDGVRTAYAAAGAANPVEMADMRATATLLAPQVKATGGSAQGLDGMAQGAPNLRRTEPNREASGTGWIGLQRRHDHVVDVEPDTLPEVDSEDLAQ